MRITYDAEADALAILFREDASIEDSIDLEDGFTVWFDHKRRVMGIEVLAASDRLGPDPLSHLAVERLDK